MAESEIVKRFDGSNLVRLPFRCYVPTRISHMNDRPTGSPDTRIRRAVSARRVVCVYALIVGSVVGLSALTAAQSSFTAYEDVQQILPFLTDSLPPELKSPALPARRSNWGEWVVGHDREIRGRLLRGDEDTVVNWLLFGTSFTAEPRALFEVSPTSDDLERVISRRIRDLISTLRSTDANEHSAFAREVLQRQGYGFAAAGDRAKLEGHLRAEIQRVVAERQQYAQREEAFPAGDFARQMMVQSTLFRDRGLSLDTSILSCFAIDQALETMKEQGLLAANGIRRVAVIGPGLDFADKNSGYDFYPVQTLQPFTTIESLERLGLAAGEDAVELSTFDISPRVNDHIRAVRIAPKRASRMCCACRWTECLSGPPI